MTQVVKPNFSNDLTMVDNTFDQLHEYLVKNDFKGWEYDDLLASNFVSALTFNFLWPKIIAVQISKRSPINLRPLLGVPKLKSTKAYGFILKGYLLKGGLNKENRYLELIKEGLSWLMDNRSKGYSGYCWGNDFDFASRAGYFPKELPTIVWTSHIQETFDLAYTATGNENYKDVVNSVSEFICNDLDRIKDESGFCFAYAPGINFPIHNSNLLGVAALLRSYKYTKNEKHLEIAKDACNWSVAKQNDDGSWYYGAIPMLHWIDNYHTGYNLDCMKLANEIGGEDFIKTEIITSTYKYWIENLFDEDMAPRFYNKSSFPRDIQATAQAIESFCKYSTIDENALNKAFAVFNWAQENMLKANNSFAYRIYKNGKRNNLEAIHWGQSTMLSAMGHLSYYCARK